MMPAPKPIRVVLSMPVLDGLGALAGIQRDYPGTGVLILTMHGEEAIVLRALDAGANGFIRKDADSAEVIGAIRAIAAGNSWIEPRAAVLLLDEYRRLRAVAGSASAGRSNKEIAAELGIAESTVKNQLGSLFGRLEVSDRTQAALYAFAHGILPPEEPVRPSPFTAMPPRGRSV